jgi:hypothetical protein
MNSPEASPSRSMQQSGIARLRGRLLKRTRAFADEGRSAIGLDARGQGLP